MGAVVVPLVEEHVTETGADNCGYAHVDEQGSKPALGRSLALEHASHNVEAKHKAYGKHQSIPPYGNKTVDNGGIDIPCNEFRKHHLLFLLKYSFVAALTLGLRAMMAIIVGMAIRA